jgi:hypothetical protein
MQAEYQMPTKQAKQQVQSKQAGLRTQSKPAGLQVQPKQAKQQVQSKQAKQQVQSKQTKQQAQSKQAVRPAQNVSKRPESPQFPVYSGYTKRKYSAPQVQSKPVKQPAGHPSPTYSVYKTSKHSVHQVQGGYMQAATSDVPFHPMRGQRIMTTGAVYASTVYVPFDSKTPASYSEDLAMADRGLRRAKQDFIQRPDDDPAQTSPVGEPWIMAIFALLFGGIVALRRRNRGASRVLRGNHVSYHTL